MKRNTLYIIGRRNFEKQQIGQIMSAELVKTEEPNEAPSLGFGDGYYYKILFGKDTKGTMYMALALEEWGAGEWHGAYKSCGHWHGAGCNHFVKGYHIKLRKNFKTVEEANHYYNIVKTNFYNVTVQDDKRYTEAQIDKLFA